MALLVVGDEVLAGDVVEANAGALVQRIRGTRTRLVRIVIVPDTVEAIVGELPRLQALAEIVVLSGGIGPTHDDVTRPALSRLLGRPLTRHDDAVRRIRGFYGAAVTEDELAMADLPAGAELVVGPRSGTFGFKIDALYVLPGVPALFADVLDAMATALAGEALPQCELVTALREGEIAPFLREVVESSPGVTIGSYPALHQGTWTVRLVLRCADPTRLARVRDQLDARLRVAADR